MFISAAAQKETESDEIDWVWENKVGYGWANSAICLSIPHWVSWALSAIKKGLRV